MSTLGKAIKLTAESFENIKDKGGAFYILHCLYVMNEMPEYDDELRCIAVMHDIVEDTDYTIQSLKECQFSDRVIDAIKLLTHEKDVPYMDYIRQLAHNPDARKVKMADLRHNSDIMRMKGLREKDFRRLEKYHTAYEYLKD